MDKNEKEFLEDCLTLLARATERGILVALVRRQDGNDQANYIMTNVKDADTIRALLSPEWVTEESAE